MNTFISLVGQLDWFTKEVDQPFHDLNNSQVIDSTIVQWNPIRGGASAIADGIWGIKKTPISKFSDASANLLQVIQNTMNRVLWLIALIAVIYLIVLGIQILFNPKDEEIKKIQSRISAALWAIGGVWLSRIIVSFIFYIIKIFTNS